MSIKYMNNGFYESKKKVIVLPVNVSNEVRDEIYSFFQEKHPSLLGLCKQFYEHTEYDIGNIGVWDTDEDGLSVVFFPVKASWEIVPKPSNIETGLDRLRGFYSFWGIRELAFHPAFSEIKNLSWTIELKPMFDRLLGDLPIDI